MLNQYTKIMMKLSAGILIFLLGGILNAQEIIQDAEYYILQAQYGEDWEKEDSEINLKLKALHDKYNTPPNIIHIM